MIKMIGKQVKSRTMHLTDVQAGAVVLGIVGLVVLVFII